ncbi:MAG: TIGR03067 domain-containing protein [Planctomycetes bacterium]|nr:TIGR03067 domain-containing protein [Planctomycetota bacterium]
MTLFKTLSILSIGMVLLFGDARKEAVKKDLQGLQGKWQMQSSERDGKKAPDEFVKTFKRTVKDDTYVVTFEDGEGEHTLSGKITLDPTKSPKWLDAHMTDGGMKGKTMVAIYKLEGDTQTLCVALPGKDRPTAFDSSQGTLLVWKRESKATKADGR